jgi:hypothetical protein
MTFEIASLLGSGTSFPPARCGRACSPHPLDAKRWPLYLASLLCFVSSLLCAQTPRPTGPYRVAGVLVSSTAGHPLARARVTLQDVHNPRTQIFVITTDDGRFEFPNLPPAKYSLTGAKRGYITAAYDEHEGFSTAIVTGSDLDTEHLILRLPPAAALAGHVFDEAGDPIRRANIQLWRDDHSTGLSRTQPFRNDTTDDQGLFEFAPLNPGTYFVSVSAQPWYAMHPPSTQPGNSIFPSPDRSLDVVYPVTFYAGATSLDEAAPILLRAGDRLDFDLHLAPVPALHVLLRGTPPEPGKSEPFPMITSRTDDDSPLHTMPPSVQPVAPGVFEITAAPGKYDIRLFQPPEHQPSQTLTFDLNENTHEVDLSSAQPLAEIHATVEALHETALPLRTQIVFRNAHGRIVAGQLVGSDRTVTFSQIAPGKYDVLAGSASRAYTVVRMTVNGTPVSGRSLTVQGAPLELTLTLRGGAADVNGVAVRDGKPTSGAMVVLVPAHADSHREWFRRDQSDFDGTFSLHSVLPGTYTVLAIDNGWDLDWSKPAVLTRYLAHGEKLIVPEDSTTPIQLPKPIPIQPK